jgi:hypothetical protein
MRREGSTEFVRLRRGLKSRGRIQYESRFIDYVNVTGSVFNCILPIFIVIIRLEFLEFHHLSLVSSPTPCSNQTVSVMISGRCLVTIGFRLSLGAKAGICAQFTGWHAGRPLGVSLF